MDCLSVDYRGGTLHLSSAALLGVLTGANSWFNDVGVETRSITIYTQFGEFILTVSDEDASLIVGMISGDDFVKVEEKGPSTR